MLFVGVYGLMRIGEICYKKDGGKERYIRNADVVTTRAHINITLRNTKTDTKQRGVTKTIAKYGKNPD